MALSTSARNEKEGVEWSTISWTGTWQPNVQKLWKMKRAQRREQKTYAGIQTMWYALLNWPNEWLLLQAVSLQECASSVSQWVTIILTVSRIFRWLTVEIAVVLCISWMLQFSYSPSLLAIYPLLVPEITDATILYSRKVLKRFNRHLNYKHKFTKVTENTSCIHSWQTILK